MNRDNATAVIVPFAGVQEQLGPFRARHIRTPSVNVPAHVTLMAPFVRGESVDACLLERLRTLFAELAAPTLRFTSIERFQQAQVLYLAVSPVGPLQAMSEALLQLGGEPEYPAGEHIFHLTVAHRPARLSGAEREFRRRFGSLLPLADTASCAELYVRKADGWAMRQRFPFGQDC